MIYNYLEGLFIFFIESIYNILDSGNYLKVKFLDNGLSSKLPTKADSGCAGYDVFSDSDIIVEKNTRKLIPTGICVEIPKYYYLRVAPRSGLSLKGIDVGAGVVDSSYRGELKILLINNSGNDYHVLQGDKIAQLIMERCSNAKVELVQTLNDTSRGFGGFGSTGR